MNIQMVAYSYGLHLLLRPIAFVSIYIHTVKYIRMVGREGEGEEGIYIYILND